MDRLNKIPYLIVVFKNELKTYEIPAFRGSVISKVPKELALFHNHIEDGFRFSYPLIQYKTIDRKAALFCIGEGTNAVGSFFMGSDFNLSIGNREESFSVEDVWARPWILQTWDDTFHYSLHRWLPLNSDNYREYKTMDGLAEQVRFLERILTGNILSMAKGLNRHFDNTVVCKIVALKRSYTISYKEVRLQSFDLLFSTNVYLPSFIGLGKGASTGFGVVRELRKRKELEHDSEE